jgi:hypothetical protein
MTEERALGLTMLLGWAICCVLVALSGCVQFAAATPAVPVVMPPVERSEYRVILPGDRAWLSPASECPPVLVPADAPLWIRNAVRWLEEQR